MRDSDIEAVMDDWISITPLKLDMTDHEAMAPLERWSVRGVAQ